jgi:hypothetical protein
MVNQDPGKFGPYLDMSKLGTTNIPTNIQQQYAGMSQPAGQFQAGISKPLGSWAKPKKVAQKPFTTAAQKQQSALMNFLFPSQGIAQTVGPAYPQDPLGIFGQTPMQTGDLASILSGLEQTMPDVGQAALGAEDIMLPTGDPRAQVPGTPEYLLARQQALKDAETLDIPDTLEGMGALDPRGPEEQLQRRNELLKEEEAKAAAQKKAMDDAIADTKERAADAVQRGQVGSEAGDPEDPFNWSAPESQDAVDPNDPAQVNPALDAAANKVNEPTPEVVKNQEEAAGLVPIEQRYLPSEAEIAGMQQRAFSGTLTPEDLTSLFESETRLTNEIARLRQDAERADAELIRLGAGASPGDPNYEPPPNLDEARRSIEQRGGPEALIEASNEEIQAELARLKDAWNEERGPDVLNELRRQATQGSLADSYETKRRSLQDLRDRLNDRNRLRRQELPLEAERAQALQGLFQQLFPAADPAAFSPLAEISRVSVPGILPMLVQQQQQQQLGGLGQRLAESLGMPQELAGIGQAAGLQPNLLAPLLQQVLSQQGRGLQRPTLQYR